MAEKCPYQFDFMDPMRMREGTPFDAFRTLRENCPVALQEANEHSGEFWAVTRRQDVDFISKNPAIFSSRENLAHPATGADDELSRDILHQLVINMDPPGHNQYRKVVKNAFTMHAVDALEPMMRGYAKSIVDKVASKGQCEFASEVAAEMPLFVICALVEMPAEKRKTFSELVEATLWMDDPEMDITPEKGQAAAAEIFEIAMDLAAKHQENPKKGTVLDALLNGVVEGEALTEFEFCCFFLILIAGGVETTRTATNHGMRLLMENPDELEKLVENPSLIPGAVEEILRFQPAFNYMQRTAMEDVKVGDMDIKKGDMVRMFYPSVNHEEAVFGEDADQFKVTRAQDMPDFKSQHRTFGMGQHFCLGSHLARKELTVMFEEIVPRLRHPEMVGEPICLASNFIPGIKEMHITFDPEN